MRRRPVARPSSPRSGGWHKRYGGTAALHAVDLDLGLGVTGLLGPNGAGKTTLIRLFLTTVRRATSGTVTVLGHEASGSLSERTQYGTWVTCRRRCRSRAA